MEQQRPEQEKLEYQKQALDKEISQYPSPIAACDEQFNHLLKERERILAELKELQKKYPPR